MERHTHLLQDKAGGSHIVEILPHTLLVDNQETAIVSYSQEDITLASSASEIHCSAEQFWRCVVGADPTIAEAGCLLAQGLAHWMALERVRHALQQIEASTPPLTLPTYRFSPFVAQLLATLDGSPEQAEAVARVLRVPVHTVLSWAEQQQQRLPAGLIPEKLVEADADPRTNGSWTEAGRSGLNATASDTGVLITHTMPGPAQDSQERERAITPAADASNGNEKLFRWSSNRMEQLTAFLHSLPAGQDIDTQSAAAATHFNWPQHIVRAKLEFLRATEIPEIRASTPEKRQSRPRESSDSPSPEGDRAGAGCR